MGMFCHNCGNELKSDAAFCGACGTKANEVSVPQAQRDNQQQELISDFDWQTTLLFCAILGYLGVHRFYVGKIWTGLLKLLTLGGCFIWWIVDIIMIATGSFTDSKGLKIKQKK
jgi:TM2 domain-containing membrane protein YozV